MSKVYVVYEDRYFACDIDDYYNYEYDRQIVAICTTETKADHVLREAVADKIAALVDVDRFESVDGEVDEKMTIVTKDRKSSQICDEKIEYLYEETELDRVLIQTNEEEP